MPASICAGVSCGANMKSLPPDSEPAAVPVRLGSGPIPMSPRLPLSVGTITL